MSTAWSVVSKMAIAFAGILLLSLGLCGITVAFSHPGNSMDTITGIGFFGTLLGAGGLVLTGVIAIIVAIASAFQGGSPPPPPPRI